MRIVRRLTASRSQSDAFAPIEEEVDKIHDGEPVVASLRNVDVDPEKGSANERERQRDKQDVFDNSLQEPVVIGAVITAGIR